MSVAPPSVARMVPSPSFATTSWTCLSTGPLWSGGIINYGKSEVFSKPGDSGSIIVDIHGRVGAMLLMVPVKRTLRI